jgi:hypothetical protein
MFSRCPSTSATRIMLIAGLLTLAWRPAHTQHNSDPSLSLLIATDKAQYELGEPIYLRLHLRNASGEAVRPLAALDPKYTETVIVVSEEGGSPRAFTPLTLLETQESPPMIAPRGEVVAITPIFFGAAGWTFGHAGDFTVMATWKNSASESEVTSNSVRIRIAPGTEVGARLVSNDGASMEAGKFLVWQSGDHLTSGQALLASVIQAAPGSAVAQHARLAEASNLSREFMDFTVGRIRPADPGRALALLSSVNDAMLPSHLVLQKNLAQATSQIRLENWDVAAQLLARAQSRVDRNKALEQFLPTLHQLDRLMIASPAGVVARLKVQQQGCC